MGKNPMLIVDIDTFIKNKYDMYPNFQKKWYVFHNGRFLEYEFSYQYTRIPKSLYLKSGELARHLIKIAKKDLLEFLEI